MMMMMMMMMMWLTDEHGLTEWLLRWLLIHALVQSWQIRDFDLWGAGGWATKAYDSITGRRYYEGWDMGLRQCPLLRFFLIFGSIIAYIAYVGQFGAFWGPFSFSAFWVLRCLIQHGKGQLLASWGGAWPLCPTPKSAYAVNASQTRDHVTGAGKFQALHCASELRFHHLSQQAQLLAASMFTAGIIRQPANVVVIKQTIGKFKYRS